MCRGSGGVALACALQLVQLSVGDSLRRAQSVGDGKDLGLRSGRFGFGTLRIPDAFQLGKFGSVSVPATIVTISPSHSPSLRSAYR